MAGGSGSRKEGASLDKDRARPCHLRYRRHPSMPIAEPPPSECFKRRLRLESQRIRLHSVQTLQRDTLSIFAESRHSDFYIVHGCSILKTNRCIFKARSPRLYQALRTYSVVHSNNVIKCYIETRDIFYQLTNFTRLLYSNLDVEGEEEQLVSKVEATSPCAEYSFYLKERECEPIQQRYTEFELARRTNGKDDDAADDLSPTSSEMADSGLETGSVSPQDKTESDNSVTDLEESHAGTDYVSMDGDDLVNGSLNGDRKSMSAAAAAAAASCSSTTTTTTTAGELPNDPFYSNSFVPTGSFEFVDPNSNRYESSKKSPPDEKLCPNPEARSMTVQELRHELSHSNDPTLKKSCSSINSYYFIDASSLNDEEEMAALAKELPAYVPTTKAQDEQQNHKLTTRRLSSHQQGAGHERVAEFERELKMTEYLRPMTEPRKVKRVDSISEDKSDGAIEKEALVVEIKEADSGESTHPSPCSDNNLEDPARRPSLIRRNTFELDTNDEKLSVLRQEYERRQGHLIFQSSIPQYSGHRVDGDLSLETLQLEVAQAKLPSSVDESKDCNSLPVTLNREIERETADVRRSSISLGTKKHLARDETMPIVSGGASCADYLKASVDKSIPTTSNHQRAKTSTRMASSMNAWVVDMSDCTKNGPSSMSQSFSSSECAKRSGSSSSSSTKSLEPKHSSLGFFVNLKDMEVPPETRPSEPKPEPAKQSCEFFVDISSETKPAKNGGNNGDKKNIFSMFIDLKEPSDEEPKTNKRGRLQHGDSGESSSSSQVDQSLNGGSSGGERSKPSVFMFIESDSPVVRRRAMSSSRPSAFQRHSWNVDKSQAPATTANSMNGNLREREHKRAHSVSVDRADLRKLQTKSSNSSHSLSEVARADTLVDGQSSRRTGQNELESSRNTDTSTEEVFEFDVRDTPPNSHIETVEKQAPAAATTYEDEVSERSAGWDKTATESTESHTRKSETFDISSGSGPSPESDNQDLDDLRPNGELPYAEPNVSKVSETHKSLTETIKKIECELKKPDNAKPAASSFVRLSDLDKTPPITADVLAVSSIREERTLYRMSNSIPETSWIESKLAINRSNGPVRTLPRKLGSIMSTSLPAKHNNNNNNKSPIDDGDCESDLSSMQSSMCRSGADVSTEETETSSMGCVTKPYNRLGEDLLRMFLEEINPDVTIDVSGRRIRAHKCILSSRCQYFAAILSGGWIESAGNVISLQGYSYNAVHFALCHIYSGESNIPETLSIVELATLADMLCLEGLKEVIGYTLKVKYCHLFHKPCQVCSVGVLECMPLAAAYGLDEVYRKSLRWITRHFVRIWPCKAFASLPRELMDKCYHQHIVHMSTDNVLQTMMDCDKLLATLPNVRWAEPVYRMVSNLLETAVKFISDNFSGVLSNDNFQALGRDLTWNISRLEDNFLAAADRLPPDQACKSYSKLSKMLAAAEEPQASKAPWAPLFVDFIRKIQSRVEKCLVKEASRAARTTTWLKMDLELRRRIQELACLVILPHEPLKRPSRHSNFLKEPRAPSARISAGSRSLDLRRVKMAISEQTDKAPAPPSTTTSAPSTTQQTKKPLLLAKPKSDPLERKTAQAEAEKQVDSGVAGTAAGTAALRPKSWPNKLEVKSRYLEPRNKSSVAKESMHERVIVQQRRKIMISSSDSSRTSSPAMKRAVDKKPLAKIKLPIKKDVVKALSSDSLAGASANANKEPISKSCGITRPESPSSSSPSSSLRRRRQNEPDIGLSVDSLSAEPNKKPQQQPVAATSATTTTTTTTSKKKQPPAASGKMDTSMSTDSLMADIAATTPKSSSNVSNKVSPTLARVGQSKSSQQPYDRVKKWSPPMAQRSPLTVARRPTRTLECSTAASRNRAAAISSAYHGSPNLRRNLLDAAKTPDLPAKPISAATVSRTQPQSATTTAAASLKKEKKEADSPSKRCWPNTTTNGARTTNRATSVPKRGTAALRGSADDRASKIKCHNGGGDAPKQPTVGSRSGTFLKDEPTILKKADIKTAQIGSS